MYIYNNNYIYILYILYIDIYIIYYILYIEKEHSQKLSPYLFQNYVALYFALYWKRENWLTLIFGASLS